MTKFKKTLQDLLAPDVLQALRQELNIDDAPETFELRRGDGAETHARAAITMASPPSLNSKEARENFDFNWSAPIYAHAANQLGVELQFSLDHPTIWALYQSEGRPIHVRALSAPDPTRQGVFPFDDDYAGAFVNMDAAGPVLRVETSEGVFLMACEGNFCNTYTSQVKGLPLRPLVEINAPLTQWLADCEDDWMHTQLQDHLEAGPWQEAVGAGLYGRLCKHPDEVQQRALRNMLDTGELDEVLHRAWQWAATLDEAQLETLGRLAIEAVNDLQIQLDELDQDDEDMADDTLNDLSEGSPWPAQGGLSWLARWRTVLHRRDDLEAVACLMQHHDGGRRALDEALAPLDAQGEILARSMPIFEDLESDERLLRAADLRPDAWWVLPALG